MGDVALTMGFIGTFIGSVFIFQNLTPASNFGQGLAVASLTLAYGVVFKLVSYVAEQRVRNIYLN
jgi:flagellar motor component MotA